MADQTNQEVKNYQARQSQQSDEWIQHLGSPIGQYTQYMERQQNRPSAERRPDIEQNINTQFWKNLRPEATYQGQNYWSDPRRIARYYLAAKAAPPGTELPPWIDTNALEASYNYLKDTRQGSWVNWEPISEDDPLNEVIRLMPTPPIESIPVRERDQVIKQYQDTGYQPTPDLLNPEPTEDNRLWWQKAVSGAMPVIQYGLPALGGAVMGSALGPVGAVTGAVGMSGMTYMAARIQQKLEAGQEVSDSEYALLKFFKALNWPAEQAEKLIGLSSQTIYSMLDSERYGDLKDIWGDADKLISAYNAGAVAYESAFMTREDEQGQAYFNKWNLENPTPEKIYTPNNQDVNAFAMLEMRKLLQQGVSPSDAYIQVAQNFGILGDLKELAGNVILDPLDLLGPLTSKGIGKIGELSGNEKLATAFLGFKDAEGKRIGGSGDLVRNTRLYGDLIRQTPPTEIAELGALSRFIAGADETGNLKMYSNAPAKNPLDAMFGLDPKSRAGAILNNFSDGLASLLSIEDDPDTVLQIIKSIADMKPEDAVKASNAGTIPITVGGVTTETTIPKWFSSAEAQSIPYAIRDGLKPIQEMVDQYKFTREPKKVLDLVAEYMQVKPEELVRKLHNAQPKEAEHIFTQYMLRLQDAAKAGDKNAANLIDLFAKEDALKTLNGSKLKTMAESFFGENGAAYNTELLKMKMRLALTESVDKWAVDWFGVKPNKLVTRLGQTVKNMQSMLLLGLSPSYLANNAINNVFTLAWDGLLGLKPMRSGKKFMQEYGVIPSFMRRGVGAAEMGEVPIGVITELGQKPKQIGQNILKASIQEGTLKTIDGIVKKTDKLQIAARLSSRIEQWSSEIATTNAIMEYWEKAWQAGVGFEKIPTDLRSVLDLVQPGLADLIEKLIGQGKSKQQIEKPLFGDLSKRSVKDVMTKDETIVFNKLFPELLDELDSVVKNSTDTIERNLGFANLKTKAQNKITERIARSNERIVKDALAKAKIEGGMGAVDTFDGLTANRTDFWLQHFSRMDAIGEETSKLSGWERQLTWMNALNSEDIAFQNFNNVEAAKWLGLMQGLGADQASPVHINTMKAYADLNRNWSDFYQTRRDLMNDFYEKSDALYKAGNKDEAAALWQETNAQLNEHYINSILGEDKLQKNIDDLFVQQYADQFPDNPNAALEAQNWRSSISAVRRKQIQAQMLFRNGELSDTMITAWGDLLSPEIKAKILELNQGKPLHKLARSLRDKVNPKFYKEVYTTFIREMAEASNNNAPGRVKADNIPAEIQASLPKVPQAEKQTPKAPIVQKHEADVWQLLSEQKPELAGVDEFGNPNPEAKLEVIKYILKNSPEARRKATGREDGSRYSFGDVTVEDLQQAIAIEKIRTEAQAKLDLEPKVEPKVEPEVKVEPIKETAPTKTIEPEVKPTTQTLLADLDDYTRMNVEASLHEFIQDIDSSKVVVNKDTHIRTWEGGAYWYHDFYNSNKKTNNLRGRTLSAIDHLLNGTRSKSDDINTLIDRVFEHALDDAQRHDLRMAWDAGNKLDAIKMYDSLNSLQEVTNEQGIALMGDEQKYYDLVDMWVSWLDSENMIDISDTATVYGGVGGIEPAPKITDVQAKALQEARNREEVMNLARSIENNIAEQQKALPPPSVGREATERMIYEILDGDFDQAEGVSKVFQALAENWAKNNPGKTADDWYDTFMMGRGGTGAEELFDMDMLPQVEFKVIPVSEVSKTKGATYRGVDKTGEGRGVYKYGKGLYSTKSKKYAKGYGDNLIGIIGGMPENPLIIDRTIDFTDWLLAKSGEENMVNFNKKYPDPGEFIKSFGYDGVIDGDVIVKFDKALYQLADIPEETRTLARMFAHQKDNDAILSALNDASSKAERSQIIAAIHEISPERAASVLEDAVNKKFPDHYLLQTAPNTDTPEFKNWFGDSKLIDSSGRPLKLYHGTLSDVTTFEPGNPEAFWGDAYYATNNPNDASLYADINGPDWKNKIDVAKEQLDDVYDWYDYADQLSEVLKEDVDTIYEWIDDGTIEDRITDDIKTQLAYKQLGIENQGNVMPIYGKMEYPLDMTRDGNERLTYEMIEDPETGEFIEETGTGVDLLEAIDTAGYDLGIDTDAIKGIVGEMLYDKPLVKDVFNAMRESDVLAYAEGEYNGEYKLLGHQFLQEVADNMGYDGVIMDAWESFGPKKFGNYTINPMEGIDPDTVHYVFFNKNNIKSKFNRGTFDKYDSNILHQSDQPHLIKKGFTRWMEDGRAILHAFESSDISTLLHEITHVYTPQMSADNAKVVSSWLRTTHKIDVPDDWYINPTEHVKASEALAKAFEQYMQEGKAPTPQLMTVFEKMKQWLLDIYGKLIDGKLTDEVRGVFDEWMGAEKAGQATPAKNDNFIRNINEIGKNPHDKFYVYKDGIKGNNDNKLVAYQHIRTEGEKYSAREEGLVGAKVSDFDNALKCTTCNRNIVHVFYVQDADGIIKPYGSEHVHEAMGWDKPLTKSKTESLINQLESKQKLDIELKEKLMRKVKPTKEEANMAFNDAYTGDQRPNVQSELYTNGTDFVRVETGYNKKLSPDVEARNAEVIKNVIDIYTEEGFYPINQGSQPVNTLWDAPKNEPSLFGEQEAGWNLIQEKATLQKFKPKDEGQQPSMFDMQEQLPTIGAKQGAPSSNNVQLSDVVLSTNEINMARIKELLGNDLNTIEWKVEDGGFVRGRWITSYKNGETRTRLKLVIQKNDNTFRVYEETAPNSNQLKLIDSGKDTSGNNRLFQTAPNTDTPEFREMFKDTKVVDENGDPLVVHHATTKDFNTFDANKIGSNTDDGEFGKGFYFSPDNYNAEAYIVNPDNFSEFQPGGNVISAYLNLKNPINIRNRKELLEKMGLSLDNKFTREGLTETSDIIPNWLQENGYDGIIVQTRNDTGELFEIREIVALKPEQIKSVNNRGTWNPNDPRMLYQTAEPNAMGAPLGTADQITAPPYDEMLLDGWINEISPMIDRIQSRFNNQSAPGIDSIAGKLDENGQQMFRSYLGKVYSNMSDVKMGANRYAEGRRNFTLLDYTKRTHADNAAGIAFPYQFWTTRTAVNWMARVLANPGILADYLRLTYFGQNAEDKEGYPTRLQGKVKMELPFLPDWMGDSIYFDPMRQIFPFENLTAPFTRMAKDNNLINRQTVSAIQQMVEDGEIEMDEATKAIDTKSGAIWDKANVEARASAKAEVNNPLDFAFSLVGPSLPISYAYNLLTPWGNKDNISQLPATRTIQSVTAALGIGGARGINIEGPLRKGLGIPEISSYEDYFVDRELSNMVADGLIDTQTAMTAMMERNGDAFTQAQQRVSIQGLPKNFLSAISLDFFPEGEQEMRNVAKEYSAAWEAKDKGDNEALTKFWNEYPEYETRLATFKFDDPEERLRTYLRSKIWNVWNESNSQERKQYTQAFGDLFEDGFINKETRSYDNISTDTYAMWAASMKQQVPEQVAGAPVLPAAQIPDEVATLLDNYNSQKESKFPGINDMMNEMFALPEDSRDMYRKAHPMMDQYSAWRNNFIATHPSTASYLTSEESELYGLPPEIQQTVYTFRAEQEQYFPNIYDTQATYMQMNDSGQKKAYLKSHPELPAFWDYRKQFSAANPTAAPYILSDESLAKSILGNDYVNSSGNNYYISQDQLSEPALRLLANYFYSNNELKGGAKMELRRIWEAYGKPAGTLENWLNIYVRPSLQ